MNENVWQALLFSAIAGLSTGIGSLIALFAKKSNKTFLSVSLGFSAGVMIYVCFAELFKNSQEMLAASFGQVNVKHSIETDPDKITEDSFSLYNKEDFLSELRLLHIGEWRHTYSLARFGETVLDGTQWELEIHYSDGSKSFKCYGSNSYPYNFIEFCELLNLDG